MYGIDQKQAAKVQYNYDKRHAVSHNGYTPTQVTFSGLIDTQTGCVDNHTEILWMNWGNQASRTVYEYGRLTSRILYTW